MHAGDEETSLQVRYSDSEQVEQQGDKGAPGKLAGLAAAVATGLFGGVVVGLAMIQ